MIIEDKKQLSTMPVEQLAIRTSAEVRAWLQKNCALESTGTRAYRIWDKNTDASNSQKVWQDTLTKYRQRLPLPWIVISNGVTGYDGPLPANIAETMKLLKKYGS